MKRRCNRFINWVIPEEYISEDHAIEFPWIENPLLAESANSWEISDKKLFIKKTLCLISISAMNFEC